MLLFRFPSPWPFACVLCASVAANLFTPPSAQASDRQSGLECLHNVLQAELEKRQTKPSSIDRIRFEGIPTDPVQLKRTADLLDTLSLKFSSHFPMPKNLEVVIKDKAPPFRGFPEEVAIRNMLSQNRTLYAADQERAVILRDADGEISEAAIAHEIGHGLFQEKMSLIDPEWRTAMSHIKDYMDAFRSVFRNGVGPDLIEQLYSLPPNTQALKEAKARLDVSLPYQELFADSVAVIGLKDPNAIAKLPMEEASPSLGLMESRSRSFDTRQSKREIQELLRLESSKNRPDDHAVFKGIRFFTWEQLYSKTNDSPKRVELLDQVFSAIAAEMKEAYNNGNPIKRTAEEMNQSLRRKIRSQMN
jgi:hypothetical protein